MKAKLKNGVIFVLITVLVMTSIIAASPATSYTFTINAKGRWTKTQDAYLPDKTLVELGLDGPEDVFIDHDNRLYIADTGNRRILIYDIRNERIERTIENKIFKKPRGIFVTEDGSVYVADSGAQAILKFDSRGELVESFTRPEDVAFGQTPFKPVKISVDSKRNMYVIGEGVLNGIIQLSNGGKFLGYFSTNKVELSFVQEMQNLFFTDEQMDNLQSRVPITITNTFVDDQNTVYSTTIGMNAKNRLAKHNTAGRNIFDSYLIAPDDLSDVYVDKNGIIYASSLFGNLWVYTDDGFFIHAFGGNHNTEDIAGLFSSLSALAVDKDGTIWAVDETTSYVQSFVPTEYSNLIYTAIEKFKQGEYEEAEVLWLEILKKNQMLRLAHDSLGKIYLYTERYDQAMKHLEIANNKFYYSQAYWEVRNSWLQDRLSGLIAGMLLLIVVYQTLKRLHKKKGILGGIVELRQKVLSHRKIRDVLFVFEFFRHPIDAYYDLKIKKKGSYFGAVVVLLTLFASYIHSYFGRSFLFGEGPIEDIDFNVVVFGFIGMFALFIYTNYLVSSIKDGDGTLGEIFKLTAYAMGPLIISTLSISILSFALTYNEVFLVEMIGMIGLIWTGINLILGLQEIHNYSTRTALASVAISVGFMLLIAIVILIVMLMAEQVYDFFEVIVREVIRNVTH